MSLKFWNAGANGREFSTMCLSVSRHQPSGGGIAFRINRDNLERSIILNPLQISILMGHLTDWLATHPVTQEPMAKGSL